MQIAFTPSSTEYGLRSTIYLNVKQVRIMIVMILKNLN